MKLAFRKISRVLPTVIAGIVGLSAHTAAMAETTIRLGTCLPTPIAAQGLDGLRQGRSRRRRKAPSRSRSSPRPTRHGEEVIEGMQIGTNPGGLIGSGSFQSSNRSSASSKCPMPGPVANSAFCALTASSAQRLPICFGPKGIEVLAWWENGFRNITNQQASDRQAGRSRRHKIRVTPDKVRLATFERLGAQPAPLASASYARPCSRRVRTPRKIALRHRCLVVLRSTEIRFA